MTPAAQSTAEWLPDGRIKVTVSEGPGDFGAYYWTKDQAVAVLAALGRLRAPADPATIQQDQQMEPDIRPPAGPGVA